MSENHRIVRVHVKIHSLVSELQRIECRSQTMIIERAVLEYAKKHGIEQRDDTVTI